jgi:hypothetical protein
MSEENARKVICKYDAIKDDIIDYIVWEPTDTILGFDIMEVEEQQQYRGTKRHKNGNSKTNTGQNHTRWLHWVQDNKTTMTEKGIKQQSNSIHVQMGL